MARKVTVLKAEEEALKAMLTLVDWSFSADELDKKHLVALRSLVAKLDAPKPEPKPTGLPFHSIERALSVGKKYAKWWGDPSRHLKPLHEANATLDQLEAVARWTDKQGWLDTFTLQTVANNWGSWLSKAMATPAKKSKMGGLVGFEADEPTAFAYSPDWGDEG